MRSSKDPTKSSPISWKVRPSEDISNEESGGPIAWEARLELGRLTVVLIKLPFDARL